MIRKLATHGLVTHQPYGTVELTEAGRVAALRMMRRHRLIETYLVAELGYRWDEVHDEAEILEHAISDLMLDRIDAKLGHPTRDPHGDPIPGPDGEVHQSGRAPAVAARARRIRRHRPDLGRRPGDAALLRALVDRPGPAGDSSCGDCRSAAAPPCGWQPTVRSWSWETLPPSRSGSPSRSRLTGPLELGFGRLPLRCDDATLRSRAVKRPIWLLGAVLVAGCSSTVPGMRRRTPNGGGSQHRSGRCRTALAGLPALGRRRARCGGGGRGPGRRDRAGGCHPADGSGGHRRLVQWSMAISNDAGRTGETARVCVPMPQASEPELPAPGRRVRRGTRLERRSTSHSFAEVQAPPQPFSVLTGDFSQADLDAAMGPAVDGVWRVGPDTDGDVELSGRTAARPLGETLRLGLKGDDLAVARTPTPSRTGWPAHPISPPTRLRGRRVAPWTRRTCTRR